MQKTVTLSIVCPVFNERDNVDLFIDRLLSVLAETELSYEIIFINDGSNDDTLDKLKNRKMTIPQITIINLSRNYGKEIALTAGLDYTTGELIIPIDADLQDPPELIHDLLLEHKKGYDVVIAKRIERSVDPLFKRLTARIFYKSYNAISNIQIPENCGDFRLMTRDVVNAIKTLPENQRFMKGIFSWVGFDSSYVEYQRTARSAGKTKFNNWKLWNFALDGITSFSTLPLRIWSYLGLMVAGLAFIYGTVIIIRTFIFGVDLPGYASLLVCILFLGGIQLISIGILGEYLGRVYLEVKARPKYIVESVI